jgi:hypothetical protein
MNRFKTICLMLLLSSAAATHAPAHAFVDHAEPPVGGKVKQMPQEVRIWFTEKIELAFSSIKVFDGSGKQIDKADTHADPANQTLLHLSLPPLNSGTYKVVWRVVSVDTHVTNGDFTFQVVR